MSITSTTLPFFLLSDLHIQKPLQFIVNIVIRVLIMKYQASTVITFN